MSSTRKSAQSPGRITPSPSKRVTRKSLCETSPRDDELSINSEDRFRQPPHDIEISAGDDFEIDLTATDNSRKKSKRSSVSVSTNQKTRTKEFEKPFKQGWGRELVIHGKPGTPSKKDADVCYFSPEGKKMRNELELKTHLKRITSKLSVKCFTFDKKPVYEEPFEIVRHTGKPRGVAGKSKNKAHKQSSKTTENSKQSESEDTAIAVDSVVSVKESSKAKVQVNINGKPSVVTIERGPSSKNLRKRSTKQESLSKPVVIDDANSDDGKGQDTNTDDPKGQDTNTDDANVHAIIDDNTLDSGINITVLDDIRGAEELVSTQETTRSDVQMTHSDVQIIDTRTPPANTALASSVSETPEVDNIAVHKTIDCDGVQTVAVENIENSGTKSSRYRVAAARYKDFGTSVVGHRKGLEVTENTGGDSLLAKQLSKKAILSIETIALRSTRKTDSERVLSRGLKTPGSVAVIGKQHPGMASTIEIVPSKSPGVAATKEIIQSKSPGMASIIEIVPSKSPGVASTKEIIQRKFQVKDVRFLTHPKPRKSTPTIVLNPKFSSKKFSNAPKSNKRASSHDAGPGTRRRSTKLPSHLRDYAVGAGKDSESTVTGSDTDSLDSTDGGEESGPFTDTRVQQQVIYPRWTSNPTAEQIIQSVLAGNTKGNVAKKHTGKRKLSVNAQDSVVPRKKKRTSLTNGNDVTGIKPCGLNCEGVRGLAPKLPCERCHCLFHTTCVKYTGGNSMPFVCQTCMIAELPLGSIPINMPIIVNASSTSNMHITTSSLVQSLAQCATPTVTVVSSSARGPILATRLNKQAKRKSKMNLRTITSNADEISGQILNLPHNVSRKLDFTKTLNLKYNGLVYNIPSSCFVTSSENVKVVLPPGTLPDAIVKGGPNNPVSISSGGVGSNTIQLFEIMMDPESGEKSARHIGDDIEATGPEITVYEDSEQFIIRPKPAPKKRGRRRKDANMMPALRVVKKYSVPVCHFQTLHAGYNCMLSVFGYLRLPDLMRAANVCTTWRSVASQGSLWRTVRLRGYRVTDWQVAIDCFQDRGTRALDMRGMRHVNDDANRTWHELHSCMTQLACLRHIDFPQCPSSVLHTVTEKLTCIKHLVAESVIENVHEPMSSNAKLDLGKFANLAELEVLKLRGSVGLVQPAFSFSGGLSELSNLTKLHTLCVTTLRDLPGSEFSFLGSLTSLETLSIGDCTLWTKEIFEDLGKLNKLKFLRLEAGGSLKEAAFGSALSKLTNLESLELFKFIVSFDLADSLQTMLWLRKFSIFSETNNQSAAMNSNTLSALSHMPFLTTVEWGIFDSASNDDNVPFDSIPFMPAGASAAEDEMELDVTPEYATVNELVLKFKSLLPDTIIRVFRVPNVSARKQ